MNERFVGTLAVGAANQPQVLHTSTAKFTDKICLMQYFYPTHNYDELEHFKVSP